MRNKICEGKVFGVIDFVEVFWLICWGYLIYIQVCNIIWFGIIELVIYDIVEGLVVSLVVGGISFVLMVLVFWFSIGDCDVVLQIVVVQVGKIFICILVVYVIIQ